MPLNPNEQAQKQVKLKDRIKDQEHLLNRKDQLETNRNNEKRRLDKTEKQLNKKGVTNISKAKGATKTMEKSMAISKRRQ